MDLRQCHSGGTNVAVTDRGRGPCIYESSGADTGWAHGNINGSNSLYRAGDFVPFRLVITGLTSGTVHTLRVGYTAVRNAAGRGEHGYDYLGSYNASQVPPVGNGMLTAVVPCGGIGDTAGVEACGNTPSTLPIPNDTPGVPTGNPGTTFPTPLPGGTGIQADGDFTAWGATLEAGSAHYVACNGCGAHIMQPMPNNNSVDREIEFKFKADGATAVLAWSAHIATPLDWGFGNTYADAGSGAAGFHVKMQLVVVNGGSRDEDMNVNAIAPTKLPPPDISTTVDLGTAVTGQQVTDVANLTGHQGFPLTGEAHFFVCSPAAANPDCSQGGTEVGRGTVSVSPPAAAMPSAHFTPDEPGHYCFRVEFVPGAQSAYSPAEHTNQITAGPGVHGECFTATPVPIQLTVTKECAPANDPGSFNIFVDGQPFGSGPVRCGESVGPLDVTAGTHVVTETAGPGTDLSNYDVSFGGDCNDLPGHGPTGERCGMRDHQRPQATRGGVVGGDQGVRSDDGLRPVPDPGRRYAGGRPVVRRADERAGRPGSRYLHGDRSRCAADELVRPRPCRW